MNDRFRDGKSYIPFSYFVGASPENGYTPASPSPCWWAAITPPTWRRAIASCSSPAAVPMIPAPSLRRKGNGQWFLWEQYLMTGIRIPTSADPWA